tara:strand:- start:73 stop:762 length:690 start_codon:yes stop_codon:yes gene_type:complete
MRKVAIILARSNSKRIKNKNIIKIKRKHLIGWLIQKLKKSNFFNEIIVSTNSNKIKKISEYYGAKVPFLRSKLNSSDYATTNDALLETLKKYKKINKSKIDYICCFYASNPFFEMRKNIAGFKKIFREKYYSVFSSFEVESKYIRSFLYNKKNKVIFLNKNFSKSRTQDLPKLYLDAGQWYWLKAKSYFKKKKIITNSSFAITIDKKKNIDLDKLSDLKRLKKDFLSII